MINCSKCEELKALLQEAKRDHEFGYDGEGRCPKFFFFGDPTEEIEAEAATCDCGADAWNTRIDEALKCE